MTLIWKVGLTHSLRVLCSLFFFFSICATYLSSLNNNFKLKSFYNHFPRRRRKKTDNKYTHVHSHVLWETMRIMRKLSHSLLSNTFKWGKKHALSRSSSPIKNNFFVLLYWIYTKAHNISSTRRRQRKILTECCAERKRVHRVSHPK